MPRPSRATRRGCLCAAGCDAAILSEYLESAAGADGGESRMSNIFASLRRATFTILPRCGTHFSVVLPHIFIYGAPCF